MGAVLIRLLLLFSSSSFSCFHRIYRLDLEGGGGGALGSVADKCGVLAQQTAPTVQRRGHPRLHFEKEKKRRVIKTPLNRDTAAMPFVSLA